MQDTILLPHINSTRSKFTTNTFIYFDEHHRSLSTEYLPLFSKEGAKKIKEWQVRKDDTVRRNGETEILIACSISAHTCSETLARHLWPEPFYALFTPSNRDRSIFRSLERDRIRLNKLIRYNRVEKSFIQLRDNRPIHRRILLNIRSNGDLQAPLYLCSTFF